MITKYGPLIKVIKLLNSHDNIDEIKSLRDDFLNMIEPYIFDNAIRLGYLLTIAKKIIKFNFVPKEK